MKTVLAALNAKFVHSNLAIRYIREYALTNSCINEDDIELFETTINDSFMETAMQIVQSKPDIVGFSCYLWNVDMAIKVSSIIKELMPKTYIVFGGPEVSYNASEYLEACDQLDFVISGEGEIPFYELMEALTQIQALSASQPDFYGIRGLSFRDHGQIICNENREPLTELGSIPFPYEREMPGKILYYEASRGCPFSCSYCLSGSLGAIRFFDVERVKMDLKKLSDAGVELVKFVDRTFNANRRFAYEIWDFLIQNAANTKFHFEIAADLIDEDSIQLLGTAPKDLFQFEIGIQTTNPAILANIHRKMDFARAAENIIAIMRAGNIHCHLDLIAGLPGETMESFISSFEDCMAIRPDVLQLGFLKVLKGTSLYQDKDKYGIHHIKYPNYHVLYTNDLEYDELRGLMRLEKVFETYYNSGIFNVTLRQMLGLSDSKYAFFRSFEQYLTEKEFFSRNFDLRDKFELLYDYLASRKDLLYSLRKQLAGEAGSADTEYGGEKNMIRDMLVHDYLINTKKAALPDFLRLDNDPSVKERIQENRKVIEAYFNGTDIRKLFFRRVFVKLVRHGRDDFMLMEPGMLICNPVTSEYCYI